MRLTDFLDPFAELTEPIRQRLFERGKRARLAEERFQRLLDTYKQILQDSRYKAASEDLVMVLGAELTELVRDARLCPKCGVKAERIRLLQEIVSEPLQSVWVETHRPKHVSADDDGL